jgi:hypothetical protein
MITRSRSGYHRVIIGFASASVRMEPEQAKCEARTNELPTTYCEQHDRRTSASSRLVGLLNCIRSQVAAIAPILRHAQRSEHTLGANNSQSVLHYMRPGGTATGLAGKQVTEPLGRGTHSLSVTCDRAGNQPVARFADDLFGESRHSGVVLFRVTPCFPWFNCCSQFHRKPTMRP